MTVPSLIPRLATESSSGIWKINKQQQKPSQGFKINRKKYNYSPLLAHSMHLLDETRLRKQQGNFPSES